MFEEIEEGQFCISGAEDERWESTGSQAVKVGRGHLRKNLVLHIRSFRLYSVINVGLLKKSEQKCERLRYACWKIILQQVENGAEDSGI